MAQELNHASTMHAAWSKGMGTVKETVGTVTHIGGLTEKGREQVRHGDAEALAAGEGKKHYDPALARKGVGIQHKHIGPNPKKYTEGPCAGCKDGTCRMGHDYDAALVHSVTAGHCEPHNARMVQTSVVSDRCGTCKPCYSGVGTCERVAYKKKKKSMKTKSLPPCGTCKPCTRGIGTCDRVVSYGATSYSDNVCSAHPLTSHDRSVAYGTTGHHPYTDCAIAAPYEYQTHAYDPALCYSCKACKAGTCKIVDHHQPRKHHLFHHDKPSHESEVCSRSCATDSCGRTTYTDTCKTCYACAGCKSGTCKEHKKHHHTKTPKVETTCVKSCDVYDNCTGCKTGTCTIPEHKHHGLLHRHRDKKALKACTTGTCGTCPKCVETRSVKPICTTGSCGTCAKCVNTCAIKKPVCTTGTCGSCNKCADKYSSYDSCSLCDTCTECRTGTCTIPAHKHHGLLHKRRDKKALKACTTANCSMCRCVDACAGCQSGVCHIKEHKHHGRHHKKNTEKVLVCDRGYADRELCADTQRIRQLDCEDLRDIQKHVGHHKYKSTTLRSSSSCSCLSCTPETHYNLKSSGSHYCDYCRRGI